MDWKTGGLSASQLVFVAAVAFFQLVNVYGSVYFKSVVAQSSPVHPIVFALYRELSAGALLTIASTIIYRKLPKRSDLFPIAGLGVCLFLNQALYVVGLQLAGVTVATCLQPSIPVFCVSFAMLLRQERTSPARIVGAALAAMGAVLMVYGASFRRQGLAGDGAASSSEAIGALCLVGNCLAMAFYFIIARSVTASYPGMCLTFRGGAHDVQNELVRGEDVKAWAYVAASCWMTIAAVAVVPHRDFNMPSAYFGPLAYWVLIVSCLGYTIVTAATAVLPASVVSSFICVQPICGTAMGVLLLGEAVSKWDGAAGLILAGLAMVVLDASAHRDGFDAVASPLPSAAASRLSLHDASRQSFSLHRTSALSLHRTSSMSLQRHSAGGGFAAHRQRGSLLSLAMDAVLRDGSARLRANDSELSLRGASFESNDSFLEGGDRWKRHSSHADMPILGRVVSQSQLGTSSSSKGVIW